MDDYIKGLITSEDAIKKVRAIPSVFQISIHTTAALAFLSENDAEYQQLLDSGGWSEWYKL